MSMSPLGRQNGGPRRRRKSKGSGCGLVILAGAASTLGAVIEALRLVT